MASPSTTASPDRRSKVPWTAGLPVHPVLFLLVLALATTGGVLVWYATSWGPWAYSDSVSYVEAARNLTNGRGLVEITGDGRALSFAKQPPLYPLLLALATALRVDIVVMARWLDIIFFTIFILCLGLVTVVYSRKPWISLALPLIAITSPVLLEDYTGIMSEPAFLTLGFVGLSLLIAYLQDRKPILLVISAVMVGLAAMTRYAGGVIIIVAVIALLLFDKASAKQRLLGLACFCLLSATPLLLWTFFTSVQPGLPPGSYLSVASLWSTLRLFREGLYDILWSFLPFADAIPIQHLPISPWRVKLLGLAFVSLVVLILMAVAFRKRWKQKSSSSALSADFQLATIFIVYVPFISASWCLSPCSGPGKSGLTQDSFLPSFSMAVRAHSL